MAATVVHTLRTLVIVPTPAPFVTLDRSAYGRECDRPVLYPGGAAGGGGGGGGAVRCGGGAVLAVAGGGGGWAPGRAGGFTRGAL